ncbi:MAG: Type II secretion system protein G precursor [Firmicutes bacterium ADurb.Bin354]|nr:MAG: Type II secretion system protein G precursor [Firmicutes bacterium ADurb.Bin354]
MTKTKKILSKNKGFTLVELIVVLVILAILAAILVPTLLGYIDKARSEKDFATAQAVRVATQAQIDELYGKGDDKVEKSDINKMMLRKKSSSWLALSATIRSTDRN